MDRQFYTGWVIVSIPAVFLTSAWNIGRQNRFDIGGISILSIMEFKGISRAGNVYEKFGAMCLEVEEVIYEVKTLLM